MTTPIYSAPHVANFILESAEQERLPITQLKLLKLVYLSYGWVLAVLKRKLFEEEIEAWEYGPVVPSLYHEFKRFGSRPITERSVYMDENGQITTPSIPYDDLARDVMKKSWDVYKPFTAVALVNKTHEPETPWAKHYGAHGANTPIPDQEIQDYFTKEIREYINAASRKFR
jgi:uncharacterized phage-associated protein